MEKKINLIVKESVKNVRVDIFISNNENEISRSRIKNLILSISVFYYSFDKAREKGTLINMGE